MDIKYCGMCKFFIASKTNDNIGKCEADDYETVLYRFEACDIFEDKDKKQY
jgi:hypothetical protein